MVDPNIQIQALMQVLNESVGRELLARTRIIQLEAELAALKAPKQKAARK